MTIKAGLPKTRVVLSLQPCGWRGRQRRVQAPGRRKGAKCYYQDWTLHSMDSSSEALQWQHAQWRVQSKYVTELGEEVVK